MCNNVENGYWGSANTMFSRKLPPLYRDGVGMPFGSSALQYRVEANQVDMRLGEKPAASRAFAAVVPDNVCDGPLPNQLPEPREVSKMFHPSEDHTSTVHSLMVMQFGQFLDHDITLTPEAELEEGVDCCDVSSSLDSEDCLAIPLRPDDKFVSDDGQNCLEFRRSSAFCSETTERREQFNIITHYIDLSNIYGSDEETVCKLRSDSDGTLLHQEVEGQVYLPCLDDSGILKSGDIRAPEMPGLTGMHTLFLREHNLIANTISQHTTGLSSEEIFQETRRIMIAEFQNIVYSEFLPAVLGKFLTKKDLKKLGIKAKATKYDKKVDVSILNEFSTAAYRFGHSLIQGQVDTRYNTLFMPAFFSDCFMC